MNPTGIPPPGTFFPKKTHPRGMQFRYQSYARHNRGRSPVRKINILLKLCAEHVPGTPDRSR
jgi:hypothetical protein